MNSYRVITILLFMLGSSVVNAKLVEKDVNYSANGTNFKGYITYDDKTKGKRPGVIVVHEWWGHNDYVRKRARMLAELGYTAIALDMYGDGKQADHPKDAGKFASAIAGNLPDAFVESVSVLQCRVTRTGDVWAESVLYLGTAESSGS